MGNRKLQHVDLRQCCRGQRQFDSKIRGMAARKYRPGTVKADDPSPAGLMLGKMHRRAGEKVVDAVVRLAGLPQELPLVEYRFPVGLSEKIVVERAEVIREIISWRQHGGHLVLQWDGSIIPRGTRFFHARRRQQEERSMKHRVKLTVIDKKLYPELQYISFLLSHALLLRNYIP